MENDKWRLLPGEGPLLIYVTQERESLVWRSGIQSAAETFLYAAIVFFRMHIFLLLSLRLITLFWGPLFSDIFCRYFAVVATRPVTEMFSTPVINFSCLIRQPLIPEVKTQLRFLCSSKGSSLTPFLLLKNSY